MSCPVPERFGEYDLDHIVALAKKRFREGFDTVELLQHAKTQTEKEEAVLISLLKIGDDQIRELELICPNEANDKVLDCRKQIKAMLEEASTD